MTKPPPVGLLKSGREFWIAATESYEMRADELRILEEACREIDLINRMNVEVRKQPLIAKGHAGQPVAAPLVSEIRQHRAVLRSLLMSLKLPESEGGSVGSERSAAARGLANARWGKRAG